MAKLSHYENTQVPSYQEGGSINLNHQEFNHFRVLQQGTSVYTLLRLHHNALISIQFTGT